MDLNIISWNVKAFNHPIKRKNVMSCLKQLKAGIFFFSSRDSPLTFRLSTAEDRKGGVALSVHFSDEGKRCCYCYR